MKKRILAVLLTLCMALSLLPAGVLADDTPTSGTCGENLTWTLEDGVLTISGTGEMEDYEGNRPDRAPWMENYKDSEKIQEIVIEPGVTSIGNTAFSRCKNVTDVTIPNSITAIGKDAFRECYSLTDVAIPGSVTTIGDFAFAYCHGFTSVTIPEGVTFIGESAFCCCRNLGRVDIPASATVIQGGAFGLCDALTDIRVAEDNPEVLVKDGMLYDNGGKRLIFGGSQKGVCTIPEGVTAIGPSAFEWCDALTGVTIPDSVTVIGDSAFWECSNLTEIVIPDSVTVIEDFAFADCVKLTDITMPDSVTYIGDYAFDSCSMTEITIPDGVTYIGEHAFWFCTELTSMTIPSSVATIGAGVLSFCSSLSELRVSEQNSNYCMQNGALYNKQKTELIAYPNAKGAVTIADSVTIIGDSAFEGCGDLTSVIIPSDVTAIGKDAFWYCESLASVSIPIGVTAIGEWAFYDCKCLTDVYYEGSEEDWAKIKIDGANDPLKKATIHYNAEMPTPPDPCENGHTWDSGNITKQPTSTEKGERTYTCIVCGATRTEEIPATGGTVTPPAPDVPAVHFTDVVAGAYYADAVSWAVSKGVTNGTSATTFSPDDSCTRAQAVTFLWRAKGSPEPVSANNPFVDVAAGAYYYKAVLWAAENGITNGISGTEFGPDITCNRAQIVTFLHRCEGSPAVSGTGFNDVPAGAYYYAPVIWAVSKGVTNGTGEGIFSPMDDCTRGQIVTFLYRDMVG